MTDAAEDDIDEEIVAKISDFIDGALPPAERAEVSKKIDEDPAWKTVYDEMQEARKAISGMRKAKAPETFTNDFERNINKMSGGGFYGDKKPPSRMPFRVLVVVAVIALALVGYLMWSSETGSLKGKKHKETPQEQQAPVPTP